MSKTVQLSPEEWKQLCLLNVGQLQTYLQALTTPAPEHMAAIEAHMARWRDHMAAWCLARPLSTQPAAQTIAVEPEIKPETNGAIAPKRKGGWPKGKPRPRKPVVQEATQ